ncbi:MAG: hypothetical protein DRJ65_15180 [Acidobacteria bacterium]|nr:MAG: hypothetical protein DRJ65_15180 [Acidobacteriota bacterium]
MSATARFAVFLTIVLTIWLAEHLYVGSRLLSLPVFSQGWARRGVFAVMVVGFFAYFAGRSASAKGWYGAAWVFEYGGGLWIGTVFLLVAGFIVVDCVTLGGYVLKPWVPGLRSAAVVLALAGTLAGWIGGLVVPRVVQVELPLPGLAEAADGLRILQVSDLHLGAMAGRRRIDQIRALIDETRPEIVVVTGDLVDGDVAAVRRLLPELRQIQAPGGVFAVLGNHEYYGRGGPEASRVVLADAGFELLENRNIEVAPGVFLAAVPDDRGASQTGHPRADLPATLDGVPQGASIVLLQHSPGDEELANQLGVDLMLNGHTHGGQIWPFNLLVAGPYPHYAGVRRIGPMVQVVSRGAGLWGPPMRLFAPADVVLVTLTGVE